MWARGSEGRRKVQSWGLGGEGELLAGAKHDGATGQIPGWKGPCGRSSGEIGRGCGGGNMVPGASGIQWRY